MKNYDVIVVGSGCGLLVVQEAIAHGLKVALVDKGPFGGTCLNLGCIPSKMLIHVADRIVEIQQAARLGVKAVIEDVDFSSIMTRMRKSIEVDRIQIRQEINHIDGLDFYEGEGRFTADYTLEVNDEKVKADNIFLASGSRPFIPPINGLDTVDYLTNESLLQLTDRPDNLIIVGGGYIAVEYGHFFAAMGTRVTILEMADRLVLAEEEEISEILKRQLARRMAVHTGTQVQEVKKKGSGIAVVARVKTTDELKEHTAQQILIAVGRLSNADRLQLDRTGIELDDRGFIKVDDYLETSHKSIFAVGDANGRSMFTHAANQEALIAADNLLHNSGIKMDYSATPHAVYSYPPIASVGLTEKQAEKDYDILVGRITYQDIAKGEAMMEKDGFAKVIIDKDSGKILGFHIIGPQAPELIQEVTNAMAFGRNINSINQAMHIHPALSELIPAAINNISSPESVI